MALVDYAVICNSQEEDFGCNPDCIDREMIHGVGLFRSPSRPRIAPKKVEVRERTSN